MNKVEMQDLLTAQQMAQFVSDGYLLMDAFVPHEINEAVYNDQLTWRNRTADSVRGYSNFWEFSNPIKSVFEIPKVKGILQSLVGVNPVYDHSALHVVGAKHLKAQDWHQDSVIDVRPYGFDIQAFYFSHDTPEEMGPTLILPGSHLRKVSNASISRYKNIIGQRRLAGKAGSIAFMHQGIWHCAQPNHTDKTRYVFKLRLRPGQQQRGLFNTEGYDSADISKIFYKGYQPWQGNEDRADHVERAKLWRYVTGDDKIDVSFERALTRMSI